MTRVIATWLDGFDMALADRFELPVLSRLTVEAARARLDNGGDQLSGLSGEHLSTGLDPRAAGRASAVLFDPATYTCSQQPTSREPVFGGVPTVVFDPCYFDLPRAQPSVEGLTVWGAHDPGARPGSRPAGLREEVEGRFGPYPAQRWVYATPWASPEGCTQAGRDLTDAVRTRAEIATWLLAERLPDFELALVGVSEAHSATEGLFHGVDPSPRWQACPSRRAAGDALRSVYSAIDDLVGSLLASFPDDVHVVFALHGMGSNISDVPTMVLLGELLRRWSGDPTPDLAFDVGPDGIPQLDPDTPWGTAVWSALRSSGDGDAPTVAGGPRVPAPVRRLASPVRRAARGARKLVRRGSAGATGELSLGWMPAMRHQPHWSSMRAFALPSFYDGRVRVNVRGREADGQVDPSGYGSVLDEVEQLLRDCRDPITGEPVVDQFRRPAGDPLDVGPTDADLIVMWRPAVLGFRHPELGTIGPLPPRRTGGHTSPVGRCLVSGPGITAADLGTRSSFDVVPTVLALAGSPAPWPLSGTPMDLSHAVQGHGG